MIFFKKTNKSPAKKRQWGTEKSFTPLSMMHEKPSTLKLTLSRLAIVTTVFFWVVYIFSIILRQLYEGPQSYSFTTEAYSYALVVSFLTFSSLLYLITRHGALLRFKKHIRVARSKIDKFFAKNHPGITVLIPSYNEEYQVIRKTILSAALQEYPNLRIVLLIDDKPFPTNSSDQKKLDKTREIGNEINKFLSEPYNRFKKALNQFEKNRIKNSPISKKEIIKLADDYSWAAKYLNQKAKKENIDDHVDVFFTNQVLRALADDLDLVSQALKVSAKEGAILTYDRVHQLHQRLMWTFQANISVFERKKYISLSHESNKAMNLNSYIGLMGGTFRKQETAKGTVLIPTSKKSKNNLTIPDSDFLLTLDADSILLREYCLRLVYFLSQPENLRVAVTQTPYSSFRGAYSRIERLAGATTDIQHILHQGLTYYNATFWVGANAVIRKSALNDIVVKETVDGLEVKRYIQDRTVIEDTESSIDLTLKNWKLVNYPERLSYSATPPDFGSLVVQRRRWANGGLLIMPKLFGKSKDNLQNDTITKAEFLLRLNYMASIAWATFGLIFLLAYPYDGRLLSPLVLAAAIPYFLAMASDLKYNGYRYSDVFRIYGFNLIILPVNLAGVIKSLEQAITGKKIPFARTPKVKDRTPSQSMYVIAPLLIVAFSLFTVWRNVLVQNWGNAIFAGFNALVATWAIFAYIGIENIITDSWLGFYNWIFVDAKPKQIDQKQQAASDLNWKVVLYEGESQESSSQPTYYEKA